MNRREFLIGSAVAGRCAWGQTADESKLDRIAIMTYSFNAIIKTPAHPDDPARTLEILDVPEMYADRYHIHNVEMQHTHFASTESSYFREVRDRLKKVKSRMTNICLEFGPLNISATDPVLRTETVDLTKQWIDHAAELGCPRVMLNQGTLDADVRPLAIEALKKIGDHGKARNITVTLENRGRPWQAVAEVIQASDIRSNPDIGNFPDEEARAAGLRALYPLSHGNCHVKLNPARFDLPKAIDLSKELGYKGLYSIEAGRNNDPDPYKAVQMILDELLKDL
jgi:hypothetical protein